MVTSAPRPAARACSASAGSGSSSVSFQSSVHGSSVAYEVRARPRISPEELVWEHIALEAVTRGARRDQVARSMGPSLRDRVYVIQRRDVERQGNGAVDAASAAITHGSVLERTLEVVIVEVARAAGEAARCAGERDSVETTSRHCTSLEKKKPRDGSVARAGSWRRERLWRARR